MTPEGFIGKWRHEELKERTASHSHFNDLCALLAIEDPITADPKGDWFTFEKRTAFHGDTRARTILGRSVCTMPFLATPRWL